MWKPPLGRRLDPRELPRPPPPPPKVPLNHESSDGGRMVRLGPLIPLDIKMLMAVMAAVVSQGLI